ncbi:hypothetical protein [Acinetobacter lactucae]|uniref:hypothetical protein n=1 Tax=Acinetobacter lactucae TaxID=1785128 RepID=UPI00237BB969|nr:hypothetical protein [Acinetobacter lactucae]MDD9318392.1 hypothetical protein [Acinetobacter lactucae]
MYKDEMVSTAKRGRPAKVFTDTELREILGFVQHLNFRTKAQQQLYEMNMSCVSEHYRTLDMSDLTAELFDLFKMVNRQKEAYLKNIELYKIIQHKSTTTIPLTQLEKEILGYDQMDRDGFFNNQNALNTYSKLEKIAKSEIQRVETQSRQQALKATLAMQTGGQKRRKEESREKYWLGGVIQKYEKFLKDEGIYSEKLPTIDVLDQLVRDAIHHHAIFLGDTTLDQDRCLDMFDELSDQVQDDKRKSNPVL